jgi:hypothetical protein
MAMIARVELVSSLTHEWGGRAFKQGKPQIITNPTEIRYYRNQASFAVSMLDPEAKSKIEELPDSIDDDDDVGELENDYGGGDSENDDDDDGADTNDDGDDIDDDDAGNSNEDIVVYTHQNLMGMKKTELKDLASNLGLDVGGTVDDLKRRLIKATK